MKKILGIMIIAAGLSACTDEAGARRTLINNGYTDVKIGGRAFFTCGSGDTYATSFTAIAPGGRRVSGAVCAAALKGNTIRFD